MKSKDFSNILTLYAWTTLITLLALLPLGAMATKQVTYTNHNGGDLPNMTPCLASMTADDDYIGARMSLSDIDVCEPLLYSWFTYGMVMDTGYAYFVKLTSAELHAPPKVVSDAYLHYHIPGLFNTGAVITVSFRITDHTWNRIDVNLMDTLYSTGGAVYSFTTEKVIMHMKLQSGTSAVEFNNYDGSWASAEFATSSFYTTALDFQTFEFEATGNSVIVSLNGDFVIEYNTLTSTDEVRMLEFVNYPGIEIYKLGYYRGT